MYWSYLHQLRDSELQHHLVFVMVRYKPMFLRLSPAIFLFIDMMFIDFPRYYPYILPTFSPCNIIPHLITIKSPLNYLLPKDLLPLYSIYIYIHIIFRYIYICIYIYVYIYIFIHIIILILLIAILLIRIYA